MVYSFTSNALWCLPYYTIATLSVIIIIKIEIWWHFVLICFSLITREGEHFSLVLFMFLDLFCGCFLLIDEYITHADAHTHTTIHPVCCKYSLSLCLVFNFFPHVLKCSQICNILNYFIFFSFLSLISLDFFFFVYLTHPILPTTLALPWV